MDLDTQDDRGQLAAQTRRLQIELDSERAKSARLLESNKDLALEVHELRKVVTDSDERTDCAKAFAATWKRLAKVMRRYANDADEEAVRILDSKRDENEALRAEVLDHEDRWQRVVALGRAMREFVGGDACWHFLHEYADILVESDADDVGDGLAELHHERIGVETDAIGNVEAVSYLRELCGPVLGVKRLRPGAKIPVRATDRAAGLDVFACLTGQIRIEPGHVAKIPLGIALDTPVGYHLDARGRSGSESRNDFTVRLGTIDDDYRGECCAIVKAPLYVDGSGDLDGGVVINHGDKVAQLVIHKTIDMPIIEVAELSETTRGTSGFGSTGT